MCLQHELIRQQLARMYTHSVCIYNSVCACSTSSSGSSSHRMYTHTCPYTSVCACSTSSSGSSYMHMYTHSVCMSIYKCVCLQHEFIWQQLARMYTHTCI